MNNEIKYYEPARQKHLQRLKAWKDRNENKLQILWLKHEKQSKVRISYDDYCEILFNQKSDKDSPNIVDPSDFRMGEEWILVVVVGGIIAWIYKIKLIIYLINLI